MRIAGPAMITPATKASVQAVRIPRAIRTSRWSAPNAGAVAGLAAAGALPHVDGVLAMLTRAATWSLVLNRPGFCS